jgi:hypothetical protein
MFNETTGMALTALCSNSNFMGIIVNIGVKFWAARAWIARDIDEWDNVIGDDG